MFFAKKVILVEGDTEKFIIPFCSYKLAALNKKYDLSMQNICVVECGGKNNIHVFMRVLNRFKIPYVVLHDVDPVDFTEDKPSKNNKEKQELKTFEENKFIRGALDEKVGKIIAVNPEFENITGVSKEQTNRHGKVQAAYNKYDELDPSDYPAKLKNILDLLIEWNEPGSVLEV
jgi:predicted ATP-dependent endonuclease of OLD family